MVCLLMNSPFILRLWCSGTTVLLGLGANRAAESPVVSNAKPGTFQCVFHQAANAMLVGTFSKGELNDSVCGSRPRGDSWSENTP